MKESAFNEISDQIKNDVKLASAYPQIDCEKSVINLADDISVRYAVVDADLINAYQELSNRAKSDFYQFCNKKNLSNKIAIDSTLIRKINGREHIVLKNFELGTLAIYRLQKNGQLKQFNRWQRFFTNIFIAIS